MPFRRCHLAALLAALLATFFAELVPAASSAADDEDLARIILAELVAANTAPSGGNDLRPAVELLVRRLRQAGFAERDIRIVNSGENLPNLVVRLRAPEARRRPILTMAHLDVVEALPGDWTVDPFVLSESDGYLYGRGTTDNKAGAAILVATLIRLKREGFQADRDLIVMLTADEETTGDGALKLTREHRDLIDAEFALNTDGGLVIEQDGTARAFVMQTSEKVYMDFLLEATDPGGHSSLPRADSAISRLARTLVALHEFRFPVDLNETTRAFFSRWAELASADERKLADALLSETPDPALSQMLDRSPYWNALARTTCVATLLDGGHAENALPQTASAVVNCRILPHSSVEETEAALLAMAAPNGVTVRRQYPDRPSPPSPLIPEVLEPVTAIANELWPGIRVIPEMSTGATDGLFVRNVGIPVYAVSAIAENPDDVRAHGQDERIAIAAFNDASEFWYRLLRRMSQAEEGGS